MLLVTLARLAALLGLARILTTADLGLTGSLLGAVTLVTNEVLVAGLARGSLGNLAVLTCLTVLTGCSLDAVELTLVSMKVTLEGIADLVALVDLATLATSAALGLLVCASCSLQALVLSFMRMEVASECTQSLCHGVNEFIHGLRK